MPEQEHDEFKVEHDCMDPEWILWGENQPIITCRDCKEDFYAPSVLDEDEIETLKRQYER